MMRVLVACEFSGIVRDAFAAKGHDAWSCDLLPSERPGQHIQGDVSHLILDDFDMIIAHPPCTYLASSGARWWFSRKESQDLAISFAQSFMWNRCPKVCVENPIGILSTCWRKPDQTIQPWQFGHGETKATCLWLKGLPLLKPTNIVGGREARIHKMPPGKNRWRERSRTFQGIADAMADQWG